MHAYKVVGLDVNLQLKRNAKNKKKSNELNSHRKRRAEHTSRPVSVCSQTAHGDGQVVGTRVKTSDAQRSNSTWRWSSGEYTGQDIRRTELNAAHLDFDQHHRKTRRYPCCAVKCRISVVEILFDCRSSNDRPCHPHCGPGRLCRHCIGLVASTLGLVVVRAGQQLAPAH